MIWERGCRVELIFPHKCIYCGKKKFKHSYCLVLEIRSKMYVYLYMLSSRNYRHEVGIRPRFIVGDIVLWLVLMRLFAPLCETTWVHVFQGTDNEGGLGVLCGTNYIPVMHWWETSDLLGACPSRNWTSDGVPEYTCFVV